MKPTRKLFNELMEGIEALQAQREGHLTLRTFTRDQFQKPTVTPELIQQTREILRLSPTEFARQLRVTPKTLANWEQGRSHPNPQAATLILLVHKYPDTLERLWSLGGCHAPIFLSASQVGCATGFSLPTLWLCEKVGKSTLAHPTQSVFNSISTWRIIMKPTQYLQRITLNPNQCGGQPCIRGIRIRVKDILEMLAAGVSREEMLTDYPYLEAEDITAALQFAALQLTLPPPLLKAA